MTRIPGISKMLGGMRTDNTTNFSTLKTRLSASFSASRKKSRGAR
jgi:hypothetical protein